MSTKEPYLAGKRVRQRFSSSQAFSDEEMARDWTLTDADKLEVCTYRKHFRTYIALQICAMRLYGRFLNELGALSPRIVNYLNQQLELPPAVSVEVPRREATWLAHRKNILSYLGFRRFDGAAQKQLKVWIEAKAAGGSLPTALLQLAEEHLLSQRIVLPGPSVLERQIINICSTVHERTFEALYYCLSPELRRAIDTLLLSAEGEQRSSFYLLKEYPPPAKISSLKAYLGRYHTLMETGIEKLEP